MKMGEHLTSDWTAFGDVKDGSAFFKFRWVIWGIKRD